MNSISRRALSAGILTAGATAPWIARAQQPYPKGLQLKFVVGFPAGGSQDIVGRVIADRLGALWGMSTVVENVSGAGANLAIDRVAKGPTDGTQILVVPPGLATNQFLYSRMPFDPEQDIVPLGQVASIPNLLIVKNSLPFRSVAEVIAYAKANPGKLTYASSGIGATPHLSGELFKRMAGVDIVVVHYRGGAPAMNDLLSGHIDMIFSNIPDAIGQVRAGAVRALGISTLTRSTIEPQYPTIAETVPGYDTTSWIGVGVRAGTPQVIRDIIEAGTRTICADPILKARLADLVSEPVSSSAAEFSAYIAAERTKWGRLITDLKIKGD